MGTVFKIIMVMVNKHGTHLILKWKNFIFAIKKQNFTRLPIITVSNAHDSLKFKNYRAVVWISLIKILTAILRYWHCHYISALQCHLNEAPSRFDAKFHGVGKETTTTTRLILKWKNLIFAIKKKKFHPFPHNNRE